MQTCGEYEVHSIKYMMNCTNYSECGNWVISDMSELPILSLYANTGSYKGKRLILAKRKYFLLVQLSPDVLEKAKSVEMSYVQN